MWPPLGEVLQGIGPDFGKSGMVPVRFHALGGCQAVGDWDSERVNEFGSVLAHAFSADDFSTRAVGDDLHVASRGLHQKRLAMIREGILLDQRVEVPGKRFVLAQADPGNLRVREDDGHERIIAQG